MAAEPVGKVLICLIFYLHYSCSNYDHKLQAPYPYKAERKREIERKRERDRERERERELPNRWKKF